MSDDGYPVDEETIIVEFTAGLDQKRSWQQEQPWRLPQGATWRVDPDGWLFIEFKQDGRNHYVGYPPHRIHRVVEVGPVAGDAI